MRGIRSGMTSLTALDLIADQVLTELRAHDVTGDKIRLVDFDIRPGVESRYGWRRPMATDP